MVTSVTTVNKFSKRKKMKQYYKKNKEKKKNIIKKIKNGQNLYRKLSEEEK